MAQRKMIRERKAFHGDLEHRNVVDIIRDLQAEVDSYGESVCLVSEREYDYGCCGGCSSYQVYYLEYQREETDAEMAKRLKAAEKARVRREAQKAKEAAKKEAEKANREAKERAELARLLKKYGEG